MFAKSVWLYFTGFSGQTVGRDFVGFSFRICDFSL